MINFYAVVTALVDAFMAAAIEESISDHNLL